MDKKIAQQGVNFNFIYKQYKIYRTLPNISVIFVIIFWSLEQIWPHDGSDFNHKRIGIFWKKVSSLLRHLLFLPLGKGFTGSSQFFSDLLRCIQFFRPDKKETVIDEKKCGSSFTIFPGTFHKLTLQKLIDISLMNPN